MTGNLEMLLPPGWAHIDLTTEIEPQLTEVTAPVVRRAPLTRQPAVRALLRESLLPRLQTFSAGGVSAVRLPLERLADFPLVPVVAITVGPAVTGSSGCEPDDDRDPMLLIQAVGQSTEDGSVEAWDRYVALRTETQIAVDSSQFPPSPDEEAGDPALAEDLAGGRALAEYVAIEWPTDRQRMVARRVQYLVADPGRFERLTLLSFQLDHPDIPEATAFADVEVQMFDALVKTMRWTDD